MDLERTFDQLVFGESVPKPETCLGLYLSPDVIYVTQVRLKDGRPTVDHLLRVPIPHRPDADQQTAEARAPGSLNTRTLSDPDGLALLLKPALNQFKRRSSAVMVSLSPQLGLLRYFTTPPMDRRFWKTAVPAEARKLIPIPFNELVYDFQVRPTFTADSEKRKRSGVLFGVTHRSNLEGIATLVRMLGLNLLGVELAPCSVERLWDAVAAPDGADGAYAHLHLEKGEGYVLVSQNGWPILFRMIPLTQEAGAVERRKVDISGSIDFVSKQLAAQPPTQIRLSGTNQDLKGWSAALAQETGLPTRLLESAKALGIKAEEWGVYACIGCSLRYIVPNILLVDMNQKGRIGEEDRKAVYGLFGLAGAVAVILALTGMVRYIEVIMAQRELTRLQREINAVQEFRNKSPDAAKEMTTEVEEKVSAIGAMLASRLGLAKTLQLVQEDIPEPVWITQLEYQDPTGDSQGHSAGHLSLSGQVAGANLASEQDQVNQFRSKLQEDAQFGRVFNCGTPSVQMFKGHADIRGGAGAGASQNPEASMASYSFQCGSKSK